MKISKQYCRRSSDLLAHPQIAAVMAGLHEIIQDMPLLVWPGKSLAQPKLFVLQSMMNAWLDYWLRHVMGAQTQVRMSQAFEHSKHLSKRTVDFCFPVNVDGQDKVIAVEVQFGNGGRMPADFSKFKALHDAGLLALAVEIQFVNAVATRTDSGLANFEATQKWLEHESGDDYPVVLLGLSGEGATQLNLKRNSAAPDAGLLGRDGPKKLRDHLTEQLVHGTDPARLTLSTVLKTLVRKSMVKICAKRPADYRLADAGAYRQGQHSHEAFFYGPQHLASPWPATLAPAVSRPSPGNLSRTPQPPEWAPQRAILAFPSKMQ